MKKISAKQRIFGNYSYLCDRLKKIQREKEIVIQENVLAMYAHRKWSDCVGTGFESIKVNN